MLAELFNAVIYVRITKNRMHLRHIPLNKEVTVEAADPFTSPRMLVGNYTRAEKCLRQGMAQLDAVRWWAPMPAMIVHPLELLEGGLSEIEDRALFELAMSVGAKKVRLWVGNELSDLDVLDKIKGK
ncbi:hypothetical protein [Methylogaea oryzae]|nr:hypothetical protein [Methylogaea oryzae]